MRIGSERPCFLVEWYRPTLADLDDAADALCRCVASISTEGSPVQLLMTLVVPTDDVVFGIFGAESADLVAQACQQAGVPAQRLSAALDVTSPRPDASAP